MKYLIVVDMQVDFITGSLGSKQAEAIVPAVEKKIKNFDGKVIFTRDTHYADYMKTQEGTKLPVEHCIKDTEGWGMIMPCALTNGSEGYFPMKSAYDEGGYEARSSSYKSGVAEAIIDGGKELLNKLHQ